MFSPNKPTLVWFHFKLEEAPLIKKLAAHAICRYASEAANSGVRIEDINLWPAIWIQPARPIAKRFKLGDFAASIIKAYFDERDEKSKQDQAANQQNTPMIH